MNVFYQLWKSTLWNFCVRLIAYSGDQQRAALGVLYTYKRDTLLRWADPIQVRRQKNPAPRIITAEKSIYKPANHFLGKLNFSTKRWEQHIKMPPFLAINEESREPIIINSNQKHPCKNLSLYYMDFFFSLEELIFVSYIQCVCVMVGETPFHCKETPCKMNGHVKSKWPIGICVLYEF